MKSNRLISCVLILSLLLMLLPASVVADSPAIVRFSPSDSSVEVGDTVIVDLMVDDAQDLYGAEVHVAFDKARLQVLDDDPVESGIQILPGDLFPKSNPSYIAVNQADNAAGTVDFAITLLAPELPVTGSGTLASIRFAARMEGTAQLQWTTVKLADRSGQQLSHTAQNNAITIAVPPTPPPPAPPSPGNCTELIGNGDCEVNAYWRMPVTPHKANYSTADKHGGARSIRLGVEPGAPDVYSHSSAYQTIHVPANASSVTLSFWAKRMTQETPKGWVDPTQDLYDPKDIIEGTAQRGVRAVYDWQEVLILQGGCYNWLATLMRARSNDGVWAQYTYDLSAFAGQDIVVYFNAINNGNGLRTWMYVDDIHVQACYDAPPCTELVRNRSFEWTSAWTLTTTPRTANYSTSAAHTGARSMRLGIVPPTADVYSHSSAYQAIDVPAGAPSPKLTFWYKAFSEEASRSNWKSYDWSGYDPAAVIAGATPASKGTEIDWQEMLILDQNYHIVSGGVVMRQLHNDGLWRQVSYDLSPFRGKRIVLYFNVINDGNGRRTWMYVDDVSVNLCGYNIRFDPASTQVGVGATFHMDVRVENIANLYGVETTVRFNPAILEVVDADAGTAGVQVNAGDWWPTGTHIVVNSADNATGLIRFAASLLAPMSPLNGSGDVVSIPFKAKAAGTTPVAFDTAKLVDATATPLSVNMADGQVTVTTSQATLKGRVLLEGRTDHSGTAVQLEGGPLAYTNASGEYTLAHTAGTYTIHFSHASYLAQSTTATGVAGSTVTLPTVTLLGGDVNGDGEIDILDLVAVGAQFGSTSPSPPEADINADGVVDIVDIVLVAKNF
ncbi:MAG: hypothetical protein JXA09_04290 [Anaerolineae bacterium]|nr:hypothetical protein [Anaerolineae bacterium]